MTYSEARLRLNEGARALLGDLATRDVSYHLSKGLPLLYAPALGFACAAASLDLQQTVALQQEAKEFWSSVAGIVGTSAGLLGAIMATRQRKEDITARVAYDPHAYMRLVGEHNALHHGRASTRTIVRAYRGN